MALTATCERCGRRMPKPGPARLAKGRGRFCSQRCRWAGPGEPTPTQAKCWDMVVNQGHTRVEVARMLGVTTGTVYSALQGYMRALDIGGAVPGRRPRKADPPPVLEMQKEWLAGRAEVEQLRRRVQELEQEISRVGPMVKVGGAIERLEKVATRLERLFELGIGWGEEEAAA
jgi:transposase